MINNNKKAVIFVYVIFLFAIAVTLAMLIVNNSYVFFNTIQDQDIIQDTNKNIQDKAESLFKLARFFNSNWSGFVDNISCPIDIFMSWTTNSWVISTTTLNYNNWNINCSGDYNSVPLNIFLSSDYTYFSWATYSWSYTDLVSWSWLTNFLDPDLTSINFFTIFLSWVDNIDDDFNSDNYMTNSTWVTNYPDNYSDDDVNHRKKIFGYVESNTLNKNIFFNNYETNQVISGSLNNSDSINAKIWETSTWYAIIDLDWTYDLKIVRFDKAEYDNFKTLKVLETNKWKNINSWYWYIQKSLTWVLSNFYTKTWDEYVFDFVNNYYAIFISNNSSSWSINYDLSFENNFWSWVYIVPIDDNWVDLKYLWNDIIDDYWKYTYTQFYVVWKK